MNSILHYVIQFVLQVAGFFFFARFLLQACRVDFYNPISQGIVKISDPVLKPLRMIIPGYRNLDFASFLAAWLTQVLLIAAQVTLAGSYATPVQVVGFGLMNTLVLCINIFYFSLLIVIVASFVAPGSHHPALTLLQDITEPVLAPARRVIPAIGGFDLSPLLVFLLLGLIEQILRQVFAALL